MSAIFCICQAHTSSEGLGDEQHVGDLVEGVRVEIRLQVLVDMARTQFYNQRYLVSEAITPGVN